MGSLNGIGSVLQPILTMTGIPGMILGVGNTLAQQQEARNALRSQQDTALAQLQARQSLEEAGAAENAALQKAQIASDAATADTRRKAALRRAVARQKTLFSSQGIGGADGSNEAVLLGLYNDSDEDAAAQSRADSLRVAALDQSAAQRRQKNLLEAAQLSEQQNLTRLLQGY